MRLPWQNGKVTEEGSNWMTELLDEGDDATLMYLAIAAKTSERLQLQRRTDALWELELGSRKHYVGVSKTDVLRNCIDDLMTKETT